MAFSPSGGLLATANSGADTMAVFAVSAGGALTKVEGSPFATSSGPASVAFGPSGELLTTANFFDDSVSMFDATEGFVIRKVADHSEIAPGRVLSYTIRLRPAGVAGASGTVTDDLSGVLDRATYRNDAHASSGTVTVNAATKRLVWTGTLDPGAETTITYSVRIHRSADGLVSNRVDWPTRVSLRVARTGAAVPHRHADRQAAGAYQAAGDHRGSGVDHDPLDGDHPPRGAGQLRARGAEPRPG